MVAVPRPVSVTDLCEPLSHWCAVPYSTVHTGADPEAVATGAAAGPSVVSTAPRSS